MKEIGPAVERVRSAENQDELRSLQEGPASQEFATQILEGCGAVTEHESGYEWFCVEEAERGEQEARSVVERSSFEDVDAQERVDELSWQQAQCEDTATGTFVGIELRSRISANCQSDASNCVGGRSSTARRAMNTQRYYAARSTLRAAVRPSRASEAALPGASTAGPSNLPQLLLRPLVKRLLHAAGRRPRALFVLLLSALAFFGPMVSAAPAPSEQPLSLRPTSPPPSRLPSVVARVDPGNVSWERARWNALSDLTRLLSEPCRLSIDQCVVTEMSTLNAQGDVYCSARRRRAREVSKLSRGVGETWAPLSRMFSMHRTIGHPPRRLDESRPQFALNVSELPKERRTGH